MWFVLRGVLFGFLGHVKARCGMLDLFAVGMDMKDGTGTGERSRYALPKSRIDAVTACAVTVHSGGRRSQATGVDHNEIKHGQWHGRCLPRWKLA